MGRTRTLLTVLAVGWGVVFSAAPVSAAGGTVAPSTGLTDGQPVAVTLTGWLPEPSGLAVSLIQCATGSIDITTCEPTETEEIIQFDGDGSGTATIVDYTAEVIPGVCDETHRCSLYAIENPTNFGHHPPDRATDLGVLSFSAAGPHPVVPEASVNLMLPIAGAGMLGLATLIVRRRRHAHPPPEGDRFR